MGRKRAETQRRKAQSSQKRRPSLKRGANIIARRSNRIAANERLTIPAGFFSEGVTSGVARKSTTSTDAAVGGCEQRKILDEDLHGLLQPAPVKSGYYQNVSNYYLSLLAEDKPPKNTDSCKVADVDFCSGLRARIRTAGVRFTGPDLINRIRREVRDLLEGPPAMASAQKRPVPAGDEAPDECPIRLVPQSEWVYSTPVKQSVKQFVFEEDNNKFLPVVFHTSKKTKALYDIKNEYVQHVNLGRYKGGENVPIDKRFLKTICESSVDGDSAMPQAKKKKVHNDEKENVNVEFKFVAPRPVAPDECNLFLSRPAEESINIGEVIEKRDAVIEQTCSPLLFNFAENKNSEGRKFNFEQCRSALPAETFCRKDHPNTLQEKVVPLNYQHQLLLATERPCKTTKKVERRHLLKAKCLSFDSTTPPTGGAKCEFEPKKLTSWERFDYDYLEQFEKECEERVVFPSSAPNTATSDVPESSNLSQVNSMYDSFSSFPTSDFLPPWKFYPRCNFDPE